MPVAVPAISPIPSRDAARVAADLLVPLIAQGLIVRRPKVANALDRADGQRRAIRRVQQLHDRWGPDPAVLRLPHRLVGIVLADGDARRVLAQTPSPFTPATREKRAALSRFEPHGVLISTGADRDRRRPFNEEALQTGRRVHSLHAEIARVVDGEVDDAIRPIRGGGILTWECFAGAWWRIVRRVVLGDSARADVVITDALAGLRSDANWGPLAPRHRERRDRFLGRLRGYVTRAQPGSLAAHVAAAPGDVDPVGQIPQWLFAFDAAGMAVFRALALLDAHPDVADRARAEGADRLRAEQGPPSILDATVLESLRLWPTTPAILRDTTAETVWRGGMLPAGTALLIFAPYFHRNPNTLAAADAFDPGLWLDAEEPRAALMPFSLGPARCPGRQLVLLITGLVLARLLDGRAFRQTHPRPLRAGRPLPATLSPFRLRYAIEAVRRSDGTEPTAAPPTRPGVRHGGE